MTDSQGWSVDLTACPMNEDVQIRYATKAYSGRMLTGTTQKVASETRPFDWQDFPLATHIVTAWRLVP
jgi:hypothetical protein